MADFVVHLSAEVFAAVERLARERGTSVEDVLADAVGLEEAVSQARAQGGRLLVEKQGHVYELACVVGKHE